MKPLRAIGVGTLIWALIFVIWSVMVFTPTLKDLVTLQWSIHYILLALIVWFGSSLYYTKNDKTSGWKVGLIFLGTGIFLDAIISVPLFIKVPLQEYFLQPQLLLGFAELLAVTQIYWVKKVK